MVAVLGVSFIIPLVLMGILFFVFWLITLIDAITRKFKEGNEKILWVLVIILTGIIGSLIYYFVVYRKDKIKTMKWFWWILLILFVLFMVSFIIGMLNSTLIS